MLEGKLDRTAVRTFALGEEPSDVAYWRSRPPGERLAQVTSLVLEHHGDPLPPMEKRVTALRKRGDEKPSNADLTDTTPAERVGMVWELTKAAWAFKEAGEHSRGESDSASENETPRAEQRLPRHLVRLRRRGG